MKSYKYFRTLDLLDNFSLLRTRMYIEISENGRFAAESIEHA